MRQGQCAVRASSNIHQELVLSLRQASEGVQSAIGRQPFDQ